MEFRLPALALMLRSCSAIAVPPPAQSGVGSIARLVDAAAYERAKKRAVSETWPRKLDLAAFMSRAQLLGEDAAPAPPLVLDVRAPCEYQTGHLPGALSFPLFDDEERAVVGTLYKKEGHDVAVARGIEILDRKAPTFLDALPQSLQPGDELLVYCKRGGMRSGGMAWLLAQAGLEVQTLAGGYQGFRAWAMEEAWAKARRVVILGGKTGSGKTEVLHALSGLGAQMLDLEGEANHRGSAFGALGRAPQPSNAQYENRLALQWARLDGARPVYIEDEARNVGSCSVPPGLWARMRAPGTALLRLDVPTEARVARLVREYGIYPPEALSDCVRAVRKRLGDETAEHLLALLARTPPALDEVAAALLTDYYDAMYEYQLAKRVDEAGGAAARDLHCDTGDAEAIARLVLEASDDL